MSGISGATRVMGVVGSPISHSLSPLIHNHWIEAAALDAVYVAFETSSDRFAAFVAGLRGGVVRGLNVTAPFKALALAAADRRSERAERAGAANLLIFAPDGAIDADNTDGPGLLWAFETQTQGFDPAAGPVLVLGAGGAARGAVAAFLDAGAAEVRLLNRSHDRAVALAQVFGDRVRAYPMGAAAAAFAEARIVINATPRGFDDDPEAGGRFDGVAAGAVAMDMVYRPLATNFLRAAAARGLWTVDGLAMLIGQAAPSFAAMNGVDAPQIDIRRLVLSALGDGA